MEHGCMVEQDLTFLLQVSSPVGLWQDKEGLVPCQHASTRGRKTLIQDREQIPWVLTVLQFCNVLHVKNCGEHLLTSWLYARSCCSNIRNMPKPFLALKTWVLLENKGVRGSERGCVGVGHLAWICRTSFRCVFFSPASSCATMDHWTGQAKNPWPLEIIKLEISQQHFHSWVSAVCLHSFRAESTVGTAGM